MVAREERIGSNLINVLRSLWELQVQAGEPCAKRVRSGVVVSNRAAGFDQTREAIAKPPQRTGAGWNLLYDWELKKDRSINYLRCCWCGGSGQKVGWWVVKGSAEAKAHKPG